MLLLKLSKILPATNGVHEDHRASELPSHPPSKANGFRPQGVQKFNEPISLKSDIKAAQQDESVGDFGWGHWTVQGNKTFSSYLI